MFVHTWRESHVEQPYRLTSIINHLHNNFWIKNKCRWKLIPGRMITNEEIKLVHSEIFLQGFLSVERGEIVDDIPSMRTLSYANSQYNFKSVGPIIAGACRTAAGTTVNIISSVVRGEIDFGFCFVRPAGHHSSKDQVGTFCGLNSISIGAVYAVEVLGLDRVLILDWDVHRSGGTEQILEEMSNEDQKKCHLIDIYAAFGKSSNSNNIPSNCLLLDLFHKNQIPDDNQYLNIFDSTIIPDIKQFSPSLILISAGFDAAEGEAEECARLTPNGYFQMTKKLKQLKIPLVFILGEYILFRDVEHSGIDSAPGINSTDSGTASNSIPLNSGIGSINSAEFRNPFQRFLAIPCNSATAGIDSDSVQFRNCWNRFRFQNSSLTFVFHLTLTFGICERFRNGIPPPEKDGIRRNSAEYRVIPSNSGSGNGRN